MPRKYQTRRRRSGYTLLLVDDIPVYLRATADLLRKRGHHVLTAESGPAALEILARHRVHVLLVDYFMPGMTGEDVLREVRRSDRLIQAVLITGYPGERPPREMIRALEIQGYHDKGRGAADLLVWVDAACKESDRAIERERTRRGLDYVFGIAADLYRPRTLRQLLPELLRRLDGLMDAQNHFLRVPNLGEPLPSTRPQSPGFVALLPEEARREKPHRLYRHLRITHAVGSYEGVRQVEELSEAVQERLRKALRQRRVWTEGRARALPLLPGGLPLGVLYLEAPARQVSDEDLLWLFASQAAVAAHNARLYQIAASSPSGERERELVLQALRRSVARAYRDGTPVTLAMLRFESLPAPAAEEAFFARAVRMIQDLLPEGIGTTGLVGRYAPDTVAMVLPLGSDAMPAVADRIRRMDWRLLAPGSPGPRFGIGFASLAPGAGEALGPSGDAAVREALELIAGAEQAFERAAR